MKVLVLPSGTEIGLEIHDALVRRRDIGLFGAESTPNSHADWVFRCNARVPHCDSPDFVSAVNALVDAQGIDYIFPAHDDVQLALVAAAGQLHCTVLSSPLETVAVTRFKKATYEALAATVPVPRLFSASDLAPADFPVFVKPDRGQGSQRAQICRDERELFAAIGSDESSMVISEYLPGEEVTVDCFSDRDSGVLFVQSRRRARTRAGISVRAERHEVPSAVDFANAISARFALYGAWFFQLKERAPGDWVLLEVGARIPGGATFARMQGVNLPLLTIFESQRIPVHIRPNELEFVMDRAFISRFRAKLDFKELYVDFDDTLSLNGAPNFDLIPLLFAAKHRNIPVMLLSRNERGAEEWLDRYALRAAFDRLVLIDKTTPKTEFMGPGALLIDDSFAERQACADAGFTSLDVDTASMLLDHLRRK